jgi:hypothetical protein
LFSDTVDVPGCAVPSPLRQHRLMPHGKHRRGGDSARMAGIPATACELVVSAVIALTAALAVERGMPVGEVLSLAAGTGGACTTCVIHLRRSLSAPGRRGR